MVNVPDAQIGFFDKKPSNAKTSSIERLPATDLMKTVASKTYDARKISKVFTDAEIEEILLKRDGGAELVDSEKKALREKYYKMKLWVKEKEKTNTSQLFVVPSLISSDTFYKVFNFSALYYVYRLADRMGRNATLRIDKDLEKIYSLV